MIERLKLDLSDSLENIHCELPRDRTPRRSACYLGRINNYEGKSPSSRRVKRTSREGIQPCIILPRDY
jgi:hypothetical protein